MTDGFGRGFSRDVEAILSVLQAGHVTGETFIYPHEVRENLRLAGMRLDGNIELPQFMDPEQFADPEYQPDWNEVPITDDEDFMDEEEVNV